MNAIIPYMWVFAVGVYAGVLLKWHFDLLRDLKKRNKTIDTIIDVHIKK